MSVLRSPIRSVVRSPSTSVAVGSLTDFERVLALSPSLLYWRAESAGTVNTDGTGAAATGTDPVGRILDLSGNANHASAPADGNRATLNATGWLFDGADDYYTLASAISITSGMTVVRAFRRPTAGTISAGLGNVALNYPMDALWFSENSIFSWLSTTAYITTTAQLTDTGSFVTSARRNGASQTLRLNGVELATSETASAVENTLGVFGRRNANYNAGEVSFLAVFPTELSGASLDFVERIAAATNAAALA